MTENPIVRTADLSAAPAAGTAAAAPPAPVVPARRAVACGWCDSTHIADVTCTCKDPCSQGWCPAAADLEHSPFVPFPRDAVA